MQIPSEALDSTATDLHQVNAWLLKSKATILAIFLLAEILNILQITPRETRNLIASLIFW